MYGATVRRLPFVCFFFEYITSGWGISSSTTSDWLHNMTAFFSRNCFFLFFWFVVSWAQLIISMSYFLTAFSFWPVYFWHRNIWLPCCLTECWWIPGMSSMKWPVFPKWEQLLNMHGWKINEAGFWGNLDVREGLTYDLLVCFIWDFQFWWSSHRDSELSPGVHLIQNGSCFACLSVLFHLPE